MRNLSRPASSSRLATRGVDQRRASPPPANGGRRGRFDHLGNLVDYGGGGSRLNKPQIQAMWSAAFATVGVTASENNRSSSSRPAKNGAASEWDRALVRAGLIKVR